jgi:hypothetical protein
MVRDDDADISFLSGRGVEVQPKRHLRVRIGMALDAQPRRAIRGEDAAAHVAVVAADAHREEVAVRGVNLDEGR